MALLTIDPRAGGGARSGADGDAEGVLVNMAIDLPGGVDGDSSGDVVVLPDLAQANPFSCWQWC